MDKRELILKTYEELLISGLDKVTSIQDIATKAGISKGSLYYYFKNKEELLEVVVDRFYARLIESAKEAADNTNGSQFQRIMVLFKSYIGGNSFEEMNSSLHEPVNAYVHQMSLCYITLNLSKVLCEIIEEGNRIGEFKCEDPMETCQIILSSLTFLLDPGLFKWTEEEFMKRIEICFDFLSFKLIGNINNSLKKVTKELFNSN